MLDALWRRRWGWDVLNLLVRQALGLEQSLEHILGSLRQAGSLLPQPGVEVVAMPQMIIIAVADVTRANLIGTHLVLLKKPGEPGFLTGRELSIRG
jgi:hypothetical protein